MEVISDFNVLPDEIGNLRLNAVEIRNKCRFLKSTTKVGCAIYTTRDNLYAGCNFDFEFGIAVHGEESAISQMINNGELDELITEVYVYAEVGGSFSSCGNCRDKIRLFAKDKKNMLVYIDNGREIIKYRLEELIPFYPER